MSCFTYYHYHQFIGCQASKTIQQLKTISNFLYEKLITPAQEVIASKRTLGIIPHGPLHQVPFSTLIRRDTAGGERYLVEDYELFNLNVRDYADFIPEHRNKSRSTNNLVGFGDPEGTLPGSRMELLKAGELFQEARLFFGKDATEGQAKEWAGTGDVLIFAVHGVFNGKGPLGSYLKLTPDNTEDGRLTAAEASRLKLDSASLVVLSACDTGVGAVVEGHA